MKYSAKVAEALHVLVLIEDLKGQEVSSASIAKSCKTNPAFIRQIMMKLRKAGLLLSTQGSPKPTLAKPASEISLFDVYRAIEGERPLLHLNTHVNPECGMGVNIQYAIGDFYSHIQKVVEREMKEISLENILKAYRSKASKKMSSPFFTRSSKDEIYPDS